jgi:hypothetical protein
VSTPYLILNPKPGGALIRLRFHFYGARCQKSPHKGVANVLLMCCYCVANVLLTLLWRDTSKKALCAGG